MNTQDIVVAVVIRKDNQLLLVQEGDDYKRGKWNIPTGHVEVGENLVTAARREAKEETGVNVSVAGILGIQNYVTHTGDQRLKLVFIGSLENENENFSVDGNEILAVQWMPIDDTRGMNEQSLHMPVTINAVLNWLDSGSVYPLSLLDDKL